MQVVKLHEDEVDIDERLVRRLLAAQAPAWADLPMRLAEPAATDNVMVRLSEELVVRLPRTESAAQGLDKEQRLVPRLAGRLPAAVPVPVLKGVSQDGYPWRWSISPWLLG
jgi:aminoglycoside phosphotransferase (APT) family kinase protein